MSFLRKHWLMFISYAISAAGLAYVIWNLHPSELKADLAGVTWWLVAVAIVLDVAPRALQAVRWQYLLRPSPIGYRFPLLAIYVGTLYSGILPLSSGDAVRGVMVARQTGTSVASVLSTEILERTADAIALILVVWFTLRGLVLPQALRLVLAALEVLIGAALVLGFVLAMNKGSLTAHITAAQPSSRIGRRLQSIATSVMRTVGSFTVGGLLVSLSTALGMAILQVGALWLILMAYHLHFSFLDAAGLFAIVTIGTFLPNTPGNIGSWQFFCVLGLSLFGVGSAQAAGFSLVAFAVLTVPPILLGVGALVVSPFSWSDLRHGRAATRAVPPGE
jgi:glycosyltransferase 2 family protein